jgi:2C-methyl-D-erythritol 2,4-cyclodiphosphate synthase
VAAVDVTILGARPRLGAARLDAMGDVIADVTGAPRDRVSVKAGTANLSGDEGAGRVISASCLVSVESR